MGQKILIVEDEGSIRKFLKINFQHQGFTVVEAESGEEGIRQARLEEPDVAVLDVMLPGMDGFEVCEILRREYPHMGIIMLTARTQDADRINGLESGADDYVIKPFNTAELVLRVKALLRRLNDILKISNSDSVIRSGPFKIDVYSQKVYKNSCELSLTPTEYIILKLFIENPGKAFARDDLLDRVWGYSYAGDPKVVDVNIRRLRSKIEDSSAEPMFIETVRGTGYRWIKV